MLQDAKVGLYVGIMVIIVLMVVRKFQPSFTL